MSMPSTAGPPTASRISSSDHAIGWYTVTTTAASVSTIMISGNSRLPVTALSDGTAIAIQPSTPVTATRPAMRMTRPSAERTRMRIPSAPIAYAATHFEASARPSSRPMAGSSAQNQRARLRSIHSHANSRYAARMKKPV